MQKIKPYVLPIAIALGLLLHDYAAMVTWLVPYLIFTVLLLNFTAVDLKKLNFNRIDFIIMVFQTITSGIVYALVKDISGSEELAQGAMICILCPVASAVVVVASVLGADRRITTGYTIYDNLLVSIIAPIYFSFIGTQQDMPFFGSAWLIFCRIAPAIALPYFIVLVMQLWLPTVKQSLSRFKEWTLPLWALALIITLGTTIDYIYLYHEGNEMSIVWLGILAVGTCILQFAVGRRIGKAMGHTVAVGQLMGQKNTGIGIWMTAAFLLPLSSVALAFYAISQNLFNSWQMFNHAKGQRKHHEKI